MGNRAVITTEKKDLGIYLHWNGGRDSVEAFLNESVGGADMVIHADDEMDTLFNEVKKELIDRIAGDASVADQAVQLLMIAKYLEKIGDYAVNVSEWAKYLVTGIHKEYQ